jgi:hypothetical protein
LNAAFYWQPVSGELLYSIQLCSSVFYSAVCHGFTKFNGNHYFQCNVRTTHLTGLFTDLGIELSQLFFYKKADDKRKTFVFNKNSGFPSSVFLSGRYYRRNTLWIIEFKNINFSCPNIDFRNIV